MAKTTHSAELHRCAIAGVQAISLASDRSFPRHTHDQFGLGVITAGAQRSWSGIGPVEAAAGDVITVNPGEMHDGSPLQGRVRCWRMLYLDPSLVIGASEDDVRDGVQISRPALTDPRLAARLGRLFASMTARRPDILDAEEQMLQTLMLLLAAYGTRPRQRHGAAPCVTQALRRLDEASAMAVTLAELAAISGVSRFQLLRGFKRAIGTTPHAYLLQRRVREARRLLAAGKRPAEAAAEAGFADQSHLTRAFSRQLGVTPARYRAALS